MSSRAGGALAALALAAGLASGCTDADQAPPTPSPAASVPTSVGPGPAASSTESGSSAPTPADPADLPLAGRVVVLDPGHQLGNRRFGAQVNRRVDAGGFAKACNTTGTATAAGYPEATFTWAVARRVERTLRRLGARVLLTRTANSDALWGPCIDVRGTIGNPGEPGPTADLRLSIHADGSLESGDRGFHVIAPGDRPGWTDDIVARSAALAVAVRDALAAAGFTPSTYRGTAGIDVRTDLGTLNHSAVPAVLAELGNMRDPADAAALTSAAGQRRLADALVTAVRAYLA